MGLLGGFLGFAATAIILMLGGIILLPIVPATLLFLMLFFFASGIGIFLCYALAPVMGFLTTTPIGTVLSRLLGLLFVPVVGALIWTAWLASLAVLGMPALSTSGIVGILLTYILIGVIGAGILFVVMCVITAVCYFWASSLYNATGAQSPLEAQVRGGSAGINLATNVIFGLAIIVPAVMVVVPPFLRVPGIVVLLGIIIAGSITAFFRNATTGILPPWGGTVVGWSTFLMPNAWLVEVIGLVLFLISLFLHGLVGWLFPLMDITTIFIRFDGAIIVRGGLAANLNPAPTFNMGTFTFERTITPAVIAPGLYSDPLFFANIPNVRNHEIGHLLNLGAFGSAFNIVGFIDQWLGTGPLTYGEDLATTNDPLFTSMTITGPVLTPARFYPTGLSMWVI